MIVLLAALVPESALLALSLRATASTRSMQTLALSAVLVQEYVLLALLTLSDQRNTDKQFRYGNCLFFCLPVSFAAACTSYKRVTVCTFRNCGIRLVCAYRNAVESAESLGYQIVPALGYIALYAFVFLLFVHYNTSSVEYKSLAGRYYYTRTIVNYS